MASNFYSRIHADYEDLDNGTGDRPGFLFEIKEQDGGVGICLYPAGDPLSKKLPKALTDEGVGRAQVFMTGAEARELLAGLEEAIERAESKVSNSGGKGHPARSREPSS